MAGYNNDDGSGFSYCHRRFIFAVHYNHLQPINCSHSGFAVPLTYGS